MVLPPCFHVSISAYLIQASAMQSITIRLTATIVENAKVGETEYFLWDENTKGFGVRVRPTGVKSWIVQYRVGKGREAQQRRVTVGKVSSLKLPAAKLRAAQYLGKAAFAEDLVEEIAEERRNEISVNDAVGMWIREAAPVNRRTGASRTAANIKADVDRLEIHVRTVLGTKRLSKVTKADIELLRDTIASGKTASKKKTKARGVRNAPGGAGTAARAIRVLSSVFAHAEDHELISRNPCRGVKLQPSNKCERFLTRDEARRLWEVLDRWDRLGKSRTGVGVIRMLTLTGARSSEITGLKWSQVDFDQGFLRLDKSRPENPSGPSPASRSSSYGTGQYSTGPLSFRPRPARLRFRESPPNHIVTAPDVSSRKSHSNQFRGHLQLLSFCASAPTASTDQPAGRPSR